MDYIDYMISEHQYWMNIESEMERLGIDDLDDYYNYLEYMKEKNDFEQVDRFLDEFYN